MRIPAVTPATARSTLTAVVVLFTLGTVSLAGCSSPSRKSFATHADDACARSVKAVAGIAAPARTSPREYAVEYFTAYDRLLAQLGDMALPAADAATIRGRWIEPARADLQALRPGLARLPAEHAAGHPDETAGIVAALRNIGAADVDPGYLRSLGVHACVPVFSGGLR